MWDMNSLQKGSDNQRWFFLIMWFVTTVNLKPRSSRPTVLCKLKKKSLSSQVLSLMGWIHFWFAFPSTNRKPEDGEGVNYHKRNWNWLIMVYSLPRLCYWGKKKNFFLRLPFLSDLFLFQIAIRKNMALSHEKISI